MIYIPKFLEIFLKNTKEKVIGIIITSPASTKGWKELLKVYFYLGYVFNFFWVVFMHILLYLLDLISLLIPLKHTKTFRGISRKYGLVYKKEKDINSIKFIEFIKKYSPDLIISIACGQIFKKDLLSIPRLGAINIHSSLLPKYRGMLPSFWVLYNKEPCTGVTVHFMDEKIDKGRIILQEKVYIDYPTTMHELITSLKIKGSKVLLKAITKIKKNPKKHSYPVIPNGKYYSLPSKEQIKKFRKEGGRLR